MVSQQKEELRRQVGGIFARAVEALGEVKDAVVRSSQIGKLKLDATFLRRERDAAALRLGDAVFARVEAGDFELDAELDPLLARIRELEAQLAETDHEIAQVHAEAEGLREVVESEKRAAEAAVDAMTGGEYEETGPSKAAS